MRALRLFPEPAGPPLTPAQAYAVAVMPVKIVNVSPQSKGSGVLATEIIEKNLKTE